MTFPRSQFLLIAIGAALMSFAAYAAPDDARVLVSTEHIIRSTKGNDIVFRSEVYYTTEGKREVAVYDTTIEKVAPADEAVVLYGRDTDFDGRFDAWFLLGTGGVAKVVDQHSAEADGWDVSGRILKENAAILKERNVVSVWFQWLARVSADKGHLRELERQEMRLHEIEIRANRKAALNKASAEARESYQFLGQAWTALAEKAQNHITDKQKAAVGDAVLAVIAAPFFRMTRQALPYVGRLFTGTTWFRYMAKFYEKYLQRAFLAATASAQRVREKLFHQLPHKIKAPYLAITESMRVTAKNLGHRIDEVIDRIDGRDRLSHALAEGLRGSMTIGRAAIHSKKYVIRIQLAQLLVELVQRRRVLFDLENPIFFEERVDSGLEMAQNLAFMTVESAFGSALAHPALKIAWYKRMGIAAVFSAGDSAFWNLLIKQGADPVRIGSDFAWEVTWGNFQSTTLDPLLIGGGKLLAKKFHNKKLKQVGWALAFSEQAASYIGYNWVTEKGNPKLREMLDERKNSAGVDAPVAHIVPIFAPEY